jgi:molybdopterin converting factor small subunit
MLNRFNPVVLGKPFEEFVHFAADSAQVVTIGGALAYDNVFLMDGVDINDNVLGQPNNLFIEDAIEETQVLTSGISAEYGRFMGGLEAELADGDQVVVLPAVAGG